MNANWIILLIGLAGGAVPSWWVTSTYYQGVVAKEHEMQQELVVKQQEKNRQDLLAYANRIVQAGAEHDKNNRTIRNLNRELSGLRINFPVCPASGTTEVGTNSGGGAGVLSDGVDAAFASLQEEAGRLVERCDQLNNDAIRTNTIIKGDPNGTRNK